ncbi:MAG: hypothetical protein A2X84_13830 [Desulfuromonadaceae bacterium GWC2_58_13]|nr:MAG: hypothetical protein A2X84_13830 [Desulfuromonadaceae bacterium GWC2_58_13]
MTDSCNLRLVSALPAPDDQIQPWQNIDRIKAINRLNYLHFQGMPAFITLKHPEYRRILVLRAHAQPCRENQVDFLWEQPDAELGKYQFEHLLISDGLKLTQFKPEVIHIDDIRISLNIPSSCREIRSRGIRRHHCTGIRVQFIQNSALFDGDLEEFTPVAMRIRLRLQPPQTFMWINPETDATVILSAGDEVLYSGICRLLRQTIDQKKRSFVVEPVTQQIHRYQNRSYRSVRQQILPPPRAAFRHPLHGKNVSLEVIDLSGSGFSVREEEENSVLLPGLVIPGLELRLASGFSMSCLAQVVCRHRVEDEPGKVFVKCGLALLDMEMADHVRLISMLYQNRDQSWQLCHQVDMDELWDFFFETGFIYPQKYAFIQHDKETLKDTYAKLYTRSPEIARHFIYQEQGSIRGHMAMLRACENAWMIHHHAASKATAKRAGLMVLRQISHYVNDVHRLSSAHMNYVYCYYRPDNRFPKRVFGGVAQYIDNQQACSLDNFAYFHYIKKSQSIGDLPTDWLVEPATDSDLAELEGYYDAVSGGLMVTAFDLEPGQPKTSTLASAYAQLGLTLGRLRFAVRKNGRLKGLVLVNLADIGLNMSELTNGLKMVVLDPEDFSREVAQAVIARLGSHFDKQEIPVLVYPAEFAEQQMLPVEKHYTLWILDLQHLDAYFKFCESLLRQF